MTRRRRIFVLAHAPMVQTRHLLDALARRDVELYCVSPTATSPAHAVTWDERGLAVSGVRLDDADAVLVRQLPAVVPGPEVFAASVDGRTDYANWFQRSCLQRDRHDVLYSWLLSVEARGGRLVNNPRASHFSRRKPFQLDTLRRLGITHPRTVITNRSDEARAFLDEVPHAIVKPAAGGALTQNAHRLSDHDLAYLRQSPAIFQERIDGKDLRVMVVGDEVVSCAGIDVPDGTLDFREDDTYRTGRITYEDATLPDDVAHDAVRFVSTMGLVFGGVDIKRTAEGRYVFLEVNSSPIYLDVERKLGHPITARLLDALLA